MSDAHAAHRERTGLDDQGLAEDLDDLVIGTPQFLYQADDVVMETSTETPESHLGLPGQAGHAARGDDAAAMGKVMAEASEQVMDATSDRLVTTTVTQYALSFLTEEGLLGTPIAE